MKKDETIRAIRSAKQYNQYLEWVNELMDSDPTPNSEDGQLLMTLTILIEDYECRKGWELPMPSNPVDVIRLRMEELGLKQADIAKAIGDKTVVSRILSGSRKLTYQMVYPLSRLLKVPAELLLEKNAA